MREIGHAQAPQSFSPGHNERKSSSRIIALPDLHLGKVPRGDGLEPPVFVKYRSLGDVLTRMLHLPRPPSIHRASHTRLKRIKLGRLHNPHQGRGNSASTRRGFPEFHLTITLP